MSVEKGQRSEINTHSSSTTAKHPDLRSAQCHFEEHLLPAAEFALAVANCFKSLMITDIVVSPFEKLFTKLNNIPTNEYRTKMNPTITFVRYYASRIYANLYVFRVKQCI